MREKWFDGRQDEHMMDGQRPRRLLIVMGDAAVQRVPAFSSDENYFIGDWQVQPRLGVITRGENSIHLEAKTLEVLARLAAKPGSVLLKDELIRAVWPDTFVSEHVLTHAIYQLRQALGNHCIQTIARRGYRLNAPVRVTPRPARIAVLPLANLCGDSDQDYFVDGTTEALISAVSQIAGLRVISRTSAMQYRSSTKSLTEIARELHVDHVVEGSVTRNGSLVRVCVQLIRGDTDEHIWAKTYDRELRDLLQWQDEVARTIAAEIQVTLTPEERDRTVRLRTVNPVAYELYLRGRYCYYRTTEESLRMSMGLMEEAIAADLEYALAHAGLASAMATLSSSFVGGMAPVDAERTVRRAVQRALELDPELPEAHHMLGWLRLFCEWDWEGAEKAYRRALDLNPSFAGGYGSMAWLHGALNRPEAAVASWQQACKLDPLNLFYQSLYGFTLLLSGNVVEGSQQLQKPIRLEPNYYYPYVLSSAALSFAGRHAEAIGMAETAVRLCPSATPKTYVGYVHARAGHGDEARAVLAELEELSQQRYISALGPAAILAALGEQERALDHLEVAQRRHEPDIVFIRAYPPWRALHGHPRFEALVQRMNFPG